MIGRILSPVMIEALTANPSRVLLFAEMDFPAGWVRVHSGVGERIILEKSFLGLGEFAGIGNITESGSESANRLNLSLKIMDPTILADLQNHDPNGRDCFIHLAALDENRQIIEVEPYIFDGEMVDLKIQKGNVAKNIPAIVSIPCSDWYERWNQAPNFARTTDAAQQHLYPNDKFFNLTEIISGSPLHTLPFKSTSNSGRRNAKFNDIE